ncbi:MAG TPA: hypothetical protein VET25_11615, partial [Aestuariivirgaceae bacterium]|nr:hypothetical protein [Aestuariivirgaceae bacterium]
MLTGYLAGYRLLESGSRPNRQRDASQIKTAALAAMVAQRDARPWVQTERLSCQLRVCTHELLLAIEGRECLLSHPNLAMAWLFSGWIKTSL